MEKLVIKEYNDFEKIVSKLNEDKFVKIDLCKISYDLKSKILNLVTGYVYDRGSIKKESANEFLVCFSK